VSFRRRLLMVMSVIVFSTVGAVAIVVLLRTNTAFARADAERTDALVAQFRREFSRRGKDVTRVVEAIATGDTVQRMATDLSHGGDPSVYLTEARSIADSHQLDLLDLAASDGSIISSAESPARFGYKEDVPLADSMSAFLASVPLPDGPTLGLLAVRAVHAGDKDFFVIGGTRLDRDFLSSLTLPAGMRALLYRAGDGEQIVGPDGSVQNASRLAPLIARVRQSGRDVSETIGWTGDTADSEAFHAIPLQSDSGAFLGALLVGSSRRSAVELQRHIAAVALIVAAAGILLAILLSGWVATRVTRPIEELANAAQEVSAGNWSAHVDPHADDELGALAESFNAMTRQLSEQRERLVQTERVAAWRELARRLAHELKNPLFPLQITVENLVRARQAEPELFDEVFHESTSTLLGEVANLKAIIGRFSDFSKMPQPQLQAVNLNDLARQVLSLHAAQLQADGKPKIEARFEPDGSLGTIEADPDLLHRALSNLVLNAMDAMPDGGRLTVRTAAAGERARIEVSDTGSGLTKEECERLFTPYYTTKQHGTGLGLAIVQSVVSDHGGSIVVESEPGKGTTFRIDLPARTSNRGVFRSAVLS
jgi:two-component system nitrogen regulation sensor histidine kinase NtrY